jgi:hypothetical protein
MSANVYRRHAADCLRAITAADSETRSFLRRMAIAWSDMADQAAEKDCQNDRMDQLPLWQQQQEA